MSNEDQTKKPSEMNPDELPGVKAFEDEFTRGFLQSTEETRPGYYHFLSGTGKYKMDFPKDGTIGEQGYALKDKDYEGIFIGVDAGEIKSAITLNYYSTDEKGREDLKLDMINDRINQELDYDKFTSENSTLYLSYFETEMYYGYAGFLQNEAENGGIRIINQTECVASKEKCDAIKAESIDVMKEIIKSIQFTVQSNESE
ncbi:hypothetical protein QGM71_05620 [Virgibacillus sp. C22-A2]|uniref:Lipoprotein YvcA n=1 Tax=Virgibacillus tibetensis TaxID=3042313 RepID=A0ABU6KCD1_9BACI|nr:hypothetical protein [Virgibacillus sp. C22-A2]